ncbi:MAG: hypothetical protein K1X92_01585 [Bacteroidia bacterium]|nr:hypothetical protein [Bacteroidia bacterium]
MKNFCLCLLIVLTFASSAFTQTIIFSNEFQSFEISYPESWKLSEYITEEVAFAAYNPMSPTPAYHETVNIKVLNTYSDDLRICAKATAEMLRERLSGFELIQTEETSSGGNHMIILEYTHFIPKSTNVKKKIKLRSRTCIILKDNKEYMITYTADKRAFNHSFEDFRRMVQTFRFIFKLNA